MLTQFHGNILSRPGQIDLRTNEGAAVVKECIEFLKVQAPSTHPLAWSNELAHACLDHVKDTGPKGITGHTGADGSSMSDRIGRYCQAVGSSGENISYGCNTPREIVLQLIVDDGVESRGHRHNMFNPSWRSHGCNTGPHSVYGTMTCQDFAGGTAAIGAANPIQEKMNAFMHEACDFTAADGAPEHSNGYSQKMGVSLTGTMATKTVTRTYNMPDGSHVELTKTFTRDLSD